MAHLGRRPRASGSVIDLSQLPSPSPSGSYHLNHSDSTLSIRMPKRRWSNFDTTPLWLSGLVESDYPLLHHCVGNFHEAGDVGAFHVVEVSVGFHAVGYALLMD